MESKCERIIFHIDVNSAYLSWTAAKQLQQGENNIDIRKIPSVVGGNSEERHGIVLAKSIPAKKFKINTGEPIISAMAKCQNLKVYPPDYKLYMRCSNAMYNLLSEYSPLIQRYSVDEVFMDASHFKEEYIAKAIEIKERMESELGFTVNIGISSNKLLAKMASDFKEKNAIHTLFKDEIESKMWILKVRDLFMVGRATEAKLTKLNIQTIGDLATYDLNVLKPIFKSYALVIHNYARGIDDSEVRSKNYVEVKGIGNSTTTSRDITSREDALKILLSLVETSAMRLRDNSSMCSVVSVSIKTDSFMRYSHQKTLYTITDSTEEIFKEITSVFDEAWRGEVIRQLGIRLSNLCSNEFYQRTFFDDNRIDKKRSLDKTIDNIRAKYGDQSIVRSTFIGSDFKPLNGGVGEEDYPMMGSIL
ncbi:Y-family DNA polymerase [Clostridium sp.]|uniref:Y-family DNA polymerase n=1 Tax=Clostridium sp. TaxID=1506 RepID=UPI002FC8B2EC